MDGHTGCFRDYEMESLDGIKTGEEWGKDITKDKQGIGKG